MKITQLTSICFLLIAFTFCKKKTETVPVPTVVEVPDIEVSYTLSKRFVKSNETIQFKNYTKNANRFEWDFGDGETSTLESPDHSYKTKGSYKISLKAYNGDKMVKLDTLIRCDLMASVTFTFFYSEYVPQPEWPSLLYISHQSGFYNSKDMSNPLKTWNSGYSEISNNKNYIYTVSLDDEQIKYKLKINTNIGGMTTGPDPNGDYYISSNEGDLYTDSFDLYTGLPIGVQKSKRLKNIMLNYLVSPIEYK